MTLQPTVALQLGLNETRKREKERTHREVDCAIGGRCNRTRCRLIERQSKTHLSYPLQHDGVVWATTLRSAVVLPRRDWRDEPHPKRVRVVSWQIRGRGRVTSTWRGARQGQPQAKEPEPCNMQYK